MNPPLLNVLIVDDSRIFRGAIAEALANVDNVRVAGSVWSGEKAVELARSSPPDLVTLDLEMPGIGGLETLRQLKAIGAARGKPPCVILISSHCRRGAAVTVEGLAEGAFDFILKPALSTEQENVAWLTRELSAKVRAFRSRTRTEHSGAEAVLLNRPSSVPGRTRFRALLIAASTGGPEALAALLPNFASGCPVPVFLVQHFPADFTEHFRDSLTRRSGCQLVTAEDHGGTRAGCVYLAPGGRHLVLQRDERGLITRLTDAPPESGCRPAADVLFRSAVPALGSSALVIVLTGMGSDGAAGARQLHDAGAFVMAQDELSSVVWGMPGSTVAAGAADQVLPLYEIGPAARVWLGMPS